MPPRSWVRVAAVAVVVAAVCCSLAAAVPASAGSSSPALAPRAAAAPGERFAYVTIHYEGTPADTEYVLGIRVLLQSLQPLQHPFIVLASSSVTQATRDLLTAEGATIRAVEDVENPFSHGLARFAHTFNKLYLWNMTEFDRLIYLDADNIAVRRDMLDDLFRCGHFCVVYMNPCHFHTGLMVVKPDAALYTTMVQRLSAVGSYDGADQGFLSSFFKKCWKAPVFNPRNGPSDAPMNALHLNYNMHAIYYFAAGHEFESLKCGVFEDEPGLAVATIGFPLPTVIKPWCGVRGWVRCLLAGRGCAKTLAHRYWWTPLVGHTPAWDAVRARLHEPELVASVLFRLVGVLGAYAILGRALAARAARPLDAAAAAAARWVPRVGVTRLARGLGLAALFVAHLLAARVTPATLPNLWGAVLYSTALATAFLLLARVAGWAVFQHTAAADRPLLPLTDARAFLAALAGFWLCAPSHAVLEFVLGRGLHVIILHALLGLVLLVGTATGLVAQLAATSPFATNLRPATPATVVASH